MAVRKLMHQHAADLRSICSQATPCRRAVQSWTCDVAACRFMKLRLDRVLKVDLSDLPRNEALQSTGGLPDYENLDQGRWTAPYLPYRPGWWKVFMPEAADNGSSQH